MKLKEIEVSRSVPVYHGGGKRSWVGLRLVAEVVNQEDIESDYNDLREMLSSGLEDMVEDERRDYKQRESK